MIDFCQDRPLLGDGPAGDRGIALKDRLWTPGQLITIGFMGGTAQQQADFQFGVSLWAQYVNLSFEFINDASLAMIRVEYTPGANWSQVGTNALGIPPNQATLSIGSDGLKFILHEFGHALGLAHEHQNPQGNIQWNMQELVTSLTGPPNNWTVGMIELNVTDRYSNNQIIGTAFDVNSIMLYPVDPSWTLNGFSSPWNESLSALDIQLIQQLYPFPSSVNVTTPIVRQTNRGTLLTNMTDDPNQPLIINDGITSVKNSSFGNLILAGLAGTAIYNWIKNN